jgi:hypothetical protein
MPQVPATAYTTGFSAREFPMKNVLGKASPTLFKQTGLNTKVFQGSKRILQLAPSAVQVWRSAVHSVGAMPGLPEWWVSDKDGPLSLVPSYSLGPLGGVAGLWAGAQQECHSRSGAESRWEVAS